MGNYQFIHLEGYSRKGAVQHRANKTARTWSINQIAREAMRCSGYHPHVTAPHPPIVVFGSDVYVIIKKAKEWAAVTKDAAGRNLRSDGLCLLAGVISVPAHANIDWVKFKTTSINFLKSIYGGRLGSIIEHTDEQHPHFHFYVVPNIGETFAAIHPGVKAVRDDRLAQKNIKYQRASYKKAMIEFQDDFYNEVAQYFGLERTGPLRPRLTRAEWRQQRDCELRLSQQKVPAQETQKQTISQDVMASNPGASDVVEDFDLSQMAQQINQLQPTPLKEGPDIPFDEDDSELNFR